MNKSESIKNIAKALSQLQAEIENPKNTANNPFFKSKYAPLPDILTLVRPLMSKYGLSVVQSPSGDGKKIVITTLLMHESGEWLESEPLILEAEKATAQGAGSAITYGRRYALSAFLGISSEDDDDGNHATGNKPEQKAPQQAQKPQTQQPPATRVPANNAPSEAQLKALHSIAKIKNVDLAARLKTKFNLESTKDLTKAQASEMIQDLQSA